MANRILYRIGVAIFIAGTLAAIMFHLGVFTPTELLYPCVFHRLSGLYCPGCGGTRSVQALLEGDVLACFFYHPFVFYCFVMYILFMVSHSLEKLCRHAKRKSPHTKIIVKGLPFRLSYVYIGIIILLLQWALKNIMVLCNIG